MWTGEYLCGTAGPQEMRAQDENPKRNRYQSDNYLWGVGRIRLATCNVSKARRYIRAM